jgi:hypothetical protein
MVEYRRLDMSASEQDFASIIDWMENLEENKIDLSKVAGPPTWNYLHALAKLTPPDTYSQEQAFKTLKQVVETFPCKTCSEHGIIYLSMHPFNGNMRQYVCDFHNDVNLELGKPLHSCNVSFNQNTTQPEVISRSKHHKRHQLIRTTPERILSRGHGEEDGTIVEAVPYIGTDFGLSFPLGPFPGAHSFEFSLGPDFPFTIFPIPYNVLNFISDPWQYDRPLTPKEYLDTAFKEEEENATE